MGMDSMKPSGQADDETAPEFPASLKIIATSFQIAGIVAAVDVLVAALGDRVSINLGVLSFLIGRGIWRLSARARWWALFCLWWTSPLMVLVVFLICASDLDATEKIGEASISALLACFAVWQLRVLLQRNIRQLFVDPELKARLVSGGKRRRYQFSLASLFGAMLVAGIVAARIGALPFLAEIGTSAFSSIGDGDKDDYEDVLRSRRGSPEEEQPWYIRHDTARAGTQPGGRLFLCSFGYREPRWGRGKKELLYAVFANAKGRMTPPVSTWMSSGGASGARLSKPDGSEIELPEPGRQLYEFSDGVYRESDQRVSMKQFVGFIRSDPEEYTIESLLLFSQAHPDED